MHAAPSAVFVDPTGRRHRRVARTCWAIGGVMAAYVALVVVSLLLPPGLSRLAVPGLGAVLPGPAAAPLGAGESGGEVAAPDVLLAPAPTPSPSARRTAAPAPAADRVPAVSTPAAVPARTPAAPAPAPRPTPSAAAPPASPAPGRAPATPPGQEPSAKPTPRASAAPATPPGQQPSRSPRPRPSRSPR